MCNFLPGHFDTIADETGIIPVVDQVELHPTFQPDGLINRCSDLRITIESWSSLRWAADLEHPAITHIAERLGATPAQVIIRWHLDRSFVVIPKLKTPARVKSNFAALEMKLSAEDRAAIDVLSTSNRIGPGPATLEIV